MRDFQIAHPDMLRLQVLAVPGHLRFNLREVHRHDRRHLRLCDACHTDRGCRLGPGGLHLDGRQATEIAHQYLVLALSPRQRSLRVGGDLAGYSLKSVDQVADLGLNARTGQGRNDARDDGAEAREQARQAPTGEERYKFRDPDWHLKCPPFG